MLGIQRIGEPCVPKDERMQADSGESRTFRQPAEHEIVDLFVPGRGRYANPEEVAPIPIAASVAELTDIIRCAMRRSENQLAADILKHARETYPASSELANLQAELAKHFKSR